MEILIPIMLLIIGLVVIWPTVAMSTTAHLPQCSEGPEVQFWKLYNAANLEDRRSERQSHNEGGGLVMKFAVMDPKTGTTFTLTKTYR